MSLTYQHRSQIGQLAEVRLKIGQSIIWESHSIGQAIFQIRLKQVLASSVFHRLRDSRLKGFKSSRWQASLLAGSWRWPTVLPQDLSIRTNESEKLDRSN